MHITNNQQLQKDIIEEIGNFTKFNINVSIPVVVPTSTFTLSQPSNDTMHDAFWILVVILIAIVLISICCINIVTYGKLQKQRALDNSNKTVTKLTQQRRTEIEPV